MINRLVAFFATGDSIVSNNLVLNLYKHINSPEARMYLSRQLYEEAVHVPLLIRGPGFPARTTVRQLVSLVDLAPTFLRTAGGTSTHPLDGAALQKIAADPAFLAHRSILLEGGVAELVPDDSPVDRRHRFYWGVRTPADTSYVRYATGESEFYDVRVDPAQLSNAVDQPDAQPAVARLARLLARLRNCRGVGCR